MSWTHPDSEYEALVYIARRLSERYTVDQGAVIELIAEELEPLGQARLRAYVPTLVEHRVRERLREAATTMVRAG